MSRDVLGELLDEDRLADHHVVDRLAEELREARHVHTLLCRLEVDEAVDLRGDELLVRPAAEADRLLDAGDARARGADPDLGRRGLEVVRQQPRRFARHVTTLTQEPGKAAVFEDTSPGLAL